MKHCPKCDAWKSENEFGKDNQTKDNLSCYCRKCRAKAQAAYQKTPAGKASKKKFYQSELGKTRRREDSRKFNQTDKYKAIKQRYNQSDKGKATAKRTYEKAKANGKIKARKAINEAVSSGKFPPAKDFSCYLKGEDCSKKMDYHHYKGYEPEYYFDVIPLCRKHHIRVEIGELMI